MTSSRYPPMMIVDVINECINMVPTSSDTKCDLITTFRRVLCNVSFSSKQSTFKKIVTIKMQLNANEASFLILRSFS